jgi:homoserine kinase type II
MAVYTQLSNTDIDNFLSAYNVGKLQSFKGIAEGVSNTNYLLTTIAPIFPPPLRGRVRVGGNTNSSHRNYLPYIKEFARSLRKNQTQAEQRLWQILRKKSLGFRFRRQFPIDNKYIADFVCLEKRLIIEIDGGQHSESIKDIERTLYLENQDFRVIRFWNNEILDNLDGCYEILLEELNKDATPHPGPPPQGGRESSTNYILTLFEKRGSARDLPFFMDLTEHLADKGIVCPRPIANNTGGVIGEIKGVPAVLVEFLPGRGNPHITPRHLELVGELAAKLHLAAADFTQSRANDLSLPGFYELFDNFRGRADEIAPGLEHEIASELAYLDKNFPSGLPSGVVHTDIFPDNVFFIDGNTDQPELSGIIDFYFSCNDFWMYDLMIVLNAWCFDATHQFMPLRAQALLGAYNKIRPLSEAEKKAAQVLARAAAMRFLVTRCFDWLNRVDGALVNIKDPMEYVKKLRFHQNNNII